MITQLPYYVFLTFALAVVSSLVQFYRASNRNIGFIALIIGWGVLHSLLAILGFYENTLTVPPRFILLVLPMLGIVLSSIFSKKMRQWLAGLNLKQLMYLHAVRIPVELVLYGLFLEAYVPELMTFEGYNLDIVAGITAPVVAWIAFRKETPRTPVLWIWNVLSILLLSNILIIAVFSTPTVIQQFAFDQPNIAVMKFPFVLLPAVIVPIVLISNMSGFVILHKKTNH